MPRAAQVPTGRGTEKQSVARPHSGKESSPKRRGILTQAVTWVDPEDLPLRETRRSQKDKSCLLPRTGRPQAVTLLETQSGAAGAGMGEGSGARSSHGLRVPGLQDAKFWRRAAVSRA